MRRNGRDFVLDLAHMLHDFLKLHLQWFPHSRKLARALKRLFFLLILYHFFG